MKKNRIHDDDDDVDDDDDDDGVIDVCTAARLNMIASFPCSVAISFLCVSWRASRTTIMTKRIVKNKRERQRQTENFFKKLF